MNDLLVGDVFRNAAAAVPSRLAAAVGDEQLTFGEVDRHANAMAHHLRSLGVEHGNRVVVWADTHVDLVPLFHMGAWTLALQQWQARDAVVFVPPEASAICDAVDRYRATRINCIPGVWQRMLDHLASDDDRPNDRTHVRFADTGTSATPREFLEAIAVRFPAACVRVFYGSTEARGVAMLEHADIQRIGSWTPFFGTRLAITPASNRTRAILSCERRPRRSSYDLRN